MTEPPLSRHLVEQLAWLLKPTFLDALTDLRHGARFWLPGGVLVTAHQSPSGAWWLAGMDHWYRVEADGSVHCVGVLQTPGGLPVVGGPTDFIIADLLPEEWETP